MGTDWLDMHDRVPSRGESEQRAADHGEAWRDRIGGWLLAVVLVVLLLGFLVWAFNALDGELS